MKKTAMQSLIEELMPFIDTSKTTPMAVFLMVQEHLDMEREQIQTAFTEGDFSSADYFNGVDDEAEIYFKQTYGPENS